MSHIFFKIIKGQGTLEGGVEVGTSKYLPGKYFSLLTHPWKFHFPNLTPFWEFNQLEFYLLVYIINSQLAREKNEFWSFNKWSLNKIFHQFEALFFLFLSGLPFKDVTIMQQQEPEKYFFSLQIVNSKTF